MILALWLSVMGVAQTWQLTDIMPKTREVVEVILGDSVPVAINHTPTNVTKPYYYSQTIVYPDEIGLQGPITSISYYKVSGSACTRNVQLFLLHTDIPWFKPSQGLGFQDMTPDNMVWQGDFVVPEEDGVWITINFDHPFYYDGSSNLIMGFLDLTGQSDAEVLFQLGKMAVYGNFGGRTITYDGSLSQIPVPDPYTASSIPSAWIGNGPGWMATTKLAFNVSDGPALSANPEQLDFGETPLGAWKHALDVNVQNTSLPVVLNSVGVTGSSFVVDGPDTPITLSYEQELSFKVSPSIEAEGTVSDTLAFVYSDDRSEVLSVPVSAIGFNPESPDVYELAQNVGSFPYSDHPTQLHNVYQLPGSNEDGPDAVYKMTFTDDVVLNASVENGSNPKIALYKEGFDGLEGPHFDNAYEWPSLPKPEAPQSSWLFYDDGVIAGAFYTMGGAQWAIKFTPVQLAQFEGCVLDRIRLYYIGEPGHVQVTVHMGGEDGPGIQVGSQEITLAAYPSLKWEEVVLEQPVLLDVTQNLWLCFYTEDLPYGACGSAYCGDPNSCWCYGGGWTTVAAINDGAGVSWMIRAFVTNERGSRELRSEGEINQMTMGAGTYYLVASSTDEGFQVNIDTETIPTPEMAYSPEPSDGAMGVMQPAKLTWSFGQYTTSYRILMGTTNPPQEVVVDWTDELDNKYLTGLLSNNTLFYWRVDERNSSGEIEGEVWQFTTVFDVPKRLFVENDKLYEGDTVVLHWEVPFDRSLISYNVYEDNVLIGSTVSTTYAVDNVVHSTNGHQFAVTAVYDDGESDKTDPVLVQVNGMGSVSGNVVEQDMVTPIAGATVKFSGLDELGHPQLYQFLTDENGFFEGALYAGTYSAAALKSGYQNEIFSSTVTVQYQTVTANIDFLLNEKYAPVGAVLAEDLDETAKITWSNDGQHADPQWIYYDADVYVDSYSGFQGVIYWGISFPDMSDYAGLRLTKIAYFDANLWSLSEGTITANIYLGGLTAPQRLVSSQDFSTKGAGSFIEIELDVPVEIDGTEPLWITCYCDNMMYPASVSGYTGDPNGRWFSVDGNTWVDHVSLNPNFTETWMLRGYLEQGSRSLQHYNLYRASCFDDESTELIAANLSDTVYMDEAWIGFEPGMYQWGVQSIYQGNGVPRDMSTILSEGFEGGAMPEGWTQYGGEWDWQFDADFAENIGIAPHDGAYAAYCNSDGESGIRYLVTPPIDLSTATTATLDFYYVMPDWDGDWDDLYVKYGPSPTGPWTTLWTAPSDTWSWTEKTIDLSDLCGGVIYLAFVERDYWGYGAAIDDVTLSADVYMPNQPHETDIVWSNRLDKDMSTMVDVTVVTNNAESPEGTRVSFVSISEPNKGYDFEVVLDDAGRYVWEDFRKGTYLYSVRLSGYESCAINDTAVIWEPSSFECMLEETLHKVEDLYVSPTGWAQWSGEYQLHGDEFFYDFEDGTLGDWTQIDADGDGFNWKLGTEGGQPPIAGHNSSHCAYSESYDPSIGGLWCDNYLVSPKVTIGTNTLLGFFACAQDEWFNDHYGVAISTRGNSNPDDFITIWEESVPSKSIMTHDEMPKGTRNPGPWYYREIDLSEYAGQQVYIALRHFQSFDLFVIKVDDISLTDGRQTKAPMSYKIKLDGIWMADLNDTHFQFDTDALVPGQTYTASVAAVFATGMSEWETYEWTYVPCGEYEGAENLSLEVEEDVVTLQWDMSELKRGRSKEGQWYYYDDGECVSVIGTEAGVSINWAVMFPAGSYRANTLTKVSMFNAREHEHQGNIMVYQGGATAPGELVYTQPYSATGKDRFVEYEFDEPIVIDDSQNLWIVMNNTTGTFVAPGSDNTGDPNGRWISMDGTTWEDVASYGLDNTWMVRAYMVADGILGTMVWRDGELLTETPIQGNTYLDENVSADWHEYCIRVVHDGVSDGAYYAMSCPLCELADVTGIGEQVTDGVSVYPNPTSGEVTIKAEGMKWIRIVDMLGRKVYDREVESDEKTLNLSSFGSGIYLVNITTENGVVNRRIVVDD